jgi:hypothetical protein
MSCVTNQSVIVLPPSQSCQVSDENMSDYYRKLPAHPGFNRLLICSPKKLRLVTPSDNVLLMYRLSNTWSHNVMLPVLNTAGSTHDVTTVGTKHINAGDKALPEILCKKAKVTKISALQFPWMRMDVNQMTRCCARFLITF